MCGDGHVVCAASAAGGGSSRESQASDDARTERDHRRKLHTYRVQTSSSSLVLIHQALNVAPPTESISIDYYY